MTAATVTHGGHSWKLDSERPDGSVLLVRYIDDAAAGWSTIVAPPGTFTVVTGAAPSAVAGDTAAEGFGTLF